MPVVWIIDSDHWPRACLRAELIERGYDAVGFETVADALAGLALPGTPLPAAVVIDLAGQELDSRRLGRLAQGDRALIGIAGAVERRQPAVLDLPWSVLLSRPVSLGAIADVIDGYFHRSTVSDALR